MRNTLFLSLAVAISLVFGVREVRAAVKQPGIIYTEEVKSISETSRTWVTVKVWEKVGNKKPVLVATVGKVGEYPTEFKLSPDHKMLAINLEKKIRLVNMADHTAITLAHAKYWFSSVDFSADSKKIVAMDYEIGKAPYAIRVFSLANNSETVVKQGVSSDFASDTAVLSATWRSKGAILVQQGCGDGGCPTGPWDVNVKTGAITTAPTYASPDPLVAVSSSYIPSGCNQFSGTAINGFKILNVATGKQVGQLKNATMSIGVTGFSPDNKQVLFYNTAVVKSMTVDPNSCPDYPTRYYYTMTFAGHVVKKVDNLQMVLRDWNLPNTNSQQRYNHKTSRTDQIFRNGKVIIQSKNVLQLQVQFWQ